MTPTVTFNIVEATVDHILETIADSRFHDDLVATAKARGKLEHNCVLFQRYRNNLPQAPEAKLHLWMQSGLPPDFPCSIDLTDD